MSSVFARQTLLSQQEQMGKLNKIDTAFFWQNRFFLIKCDKRVTNVGTKQENIRKERELRQEKIEGKTIQKWCYQEKAAV